jgi:hypothetical protein
LPRKEEVKKESTGVPQSVPDRKKPLFAEEGDLRLQTAEALVFIQEMSPDLSASDIFYLEMAVNLLNRLVDEDHVDQLSYGGYPE